MDRQFILSKIGELMDKGEIFCAYVIFKDNKGKRSEWKNLCREHGFDEYAYF